LRIDCRQALKNFGRFALTAQEPTGNPLPHNRGAVWGLECRVTPVRQGSEPDMKVRDELLDTVIRQLTGRQRSTAP